jgi:hypothetical protein
MQIVGLPKQSLQNGRRFVGQAPQSEDGSSHQFLLAVVQSSHKAGIVGQPSVQSRSIHTGKPGGFGAGFAGEQGLQSDDLRTESRASGSSNVAF